MSHNHHFFTNQSIHTLNDCIDTAMRQNGIDVLQDINAVLYEFTNNVASVEANHDKVIALTPAVAEVVKSFADLHLKVKGAAVIKAVGVILDTIDNPLAPPQPQEPVEEAAQEEVVEAAASPESQQ
jgi:hypothetical protein